jgi:hypothetical protein
MNKKTGLVKQEKGQRRSKAVTVGLGRVVGASRGGRGGDLGGGGAGDVLLEGSRRLVGSSDSLSRQLRS